MAAPAVVCSGVVSSLPALKRTRTLISYCCAIPSSISSVTASGSERHKILRTGSRHFVSRSSHALQVLCRTKDQPNASNSRSNVINMVDPLEAKRLAAEQAKVLQALAKFQRQKEIEATNGGWAMVGLTSGLFIEAYTGKNIVSQVLDYFRSLFEIIQDALPS
ncbi:hypothetical protein O6H91_01G153400 [Diphasiastrum complanatum]|uniref:Uncharacterized protein n=1 Tax=Diphasiastrum complanatum TaxID=34168 RepID=A0ACC2EXC6_DIPCM|nr:hypothetical protein O6H91_01G153400 [Diphasiastrum complanatum]